jgi:hypothetical protein
MKIPVLGNEIDERFLTHRLRSTSLAGVIGGVTAVSLFAWRYYVDDIWSWDLFAVALTIVGVKTAAMIWYWLTD